jgi:hypothetical protein
MFQRGPMQPFLLGSRPTLLCQLLECTRENTQTSITACIPIFQPSITLVVCSPFVYNGIGSQSGPQWSIVVQRGPMWSKVVQCGPKWSNMFQSGTKLFNLDQSSQKWSKPEVLINCEKSCFCLLLVHWTIDVQFALIKVNLLLLVVCVHGQSE